MYDTAYRPMAPTSVSVMRDVSAVFAAVQCLSVSLYVRLAVTLYPHCYRYRQTFCSTFCFCFGIHMPIYFFYLCAPMGHINAQKFFLEKCSPLQRRPRNRRVAHILPQYARPHPTPKKEILGAPDPLSFIHSFIHMLKNSRYTA